MSAGINWQGGLDELARELKLLPDRLMADVIDPVMESETSEAAHWMQTRYSFDSLSDGVRLDKHGPGEYRIRNTAPHAHLYELGTVARTHSDGHPTGVMPAKPVLIPEAIAARERIGRGIEQNVTKLRSPVFEVAR